MSPPHQSAERGELNIRVCLNTAHQQITEQAASRDFLAVFEGEVTITTFGQKTIGGYAIDSLGLDGVPADLEFD